MYGGIGAHVELSRSAREQAETQWLASGGDVLCEIGKQTNEYLTHRTLFVEEVVDEQLHVAYGRHNDGHSVTLGPSVSGVVAMTATSKDNKLADLATVRRYFVSTAHEQPSEEILRAETQLVAERSLPDRPKRNLADIADVAVGDGWSWKLPPVIDWKVRNTCDRIFPPLLKRRVTEAFCDSQRCRDLCGYAICAMRGEQTTCGQTAIAAGPSLGFEVEALVNDIVELTRIHIASEFNLASPPFFAGAVLNRLVPVPLAISADKSYPYHAHIDRVRVASDDFAAILHLTTQGVDFMGGNFVFVDATEDILVTPRRGRLVSFTCGPENLHCVTEVLKGARLTLAMWFTLSQEKEVKSRPTSDATILLRHEGARASHHSEDRLVNGADSMSNIILAHVDDDHYELVD